MSELCHISDGDKRNSIIVEKRKRMDPKGEQTVNEWIRGEGESPALLPGSRLLASGVAVYGLVTQV